MTHFSKYAYRCICTHRKSVWFTWNYQQEVNRGVRLGERKLSILLYAPPFQFKAFFSINMDYFYLNADLREGGAKKKVNLKRHYTPTKRSVRNMPTRLSSSWDTGLSTGPEQWSRGCASEFSALLFSVECIQDVQLVTAVEARVW